MFMMMMMMMMMHGLANFKCFEYSRGHLQGGDNNNTTWVNTTRYCKYSLVLLMMGENIARNM